MDHGGELERRIECDYCARGLFLKGEVEMSQVEFTEKMDEYIGELLKCGFVGNDARAIEVIAKVIEASRAQYVFPFGIFRSNAIPQLMCAFIKRAKGSELFAKALELSAFLTSSVCAPLYYNKIFIENMKMLVTSSDGAAPELVEYALVCLQNIAGSGKEGAMAVLDNNVIECLFEVFPRLTESKYVEHVLWIVCDVLVWRDLVTMRMLEVASRIFVSVVEQPTLTNEHAKAFIGLRLIAVHWPNIIGAVISPAHLDRIFALASSEHEILAASVIYLIEALAFGDFAGFFSPRITWDWFLSLYHKSGETVKIVLCSFMCTCIEKLGNGASVVSSGMLEAVTVSLETMSFSTRCQVISRMATTVQSSSDVALSICNATFFDILDSSIVTENRTLTKSILTIYTAAFASLIAANQRNSTFFDQSILRQLLDDLPEDETITSLTQQITSQLDTLFP